MTIAVANEVEEGDNGGTQTAGKLVSQRNLLECRVAATPDTAKVLQKLGFDVLIESQCRQLSDDAYTSWMPDRSRCLKLWEAADIVLKVAHRKCKSSYS